MLRSSKWTAKTPAVTLSPQDVLGAAWAVMESDLALLEKCRGRLKKRILAAISRHGQASPKAKSMWNLLGLVWELQAIYAQETNVDALKVKRLPESLRRRLFVRTERYVLKPGALDLVAGKLSARDRERFNRAVTRRALLPRVKVVKLKRVAKVAA